MTDWNETTLRSAASWKAFKEGQGLFNSGAVTAVKKGGDSWSGTVREGKRLFKAAVKVISASHLETRCACAENQATGAVCAHAVATGLAAMGQPSGSAAVMAPKATELPGPRPMAFSISLPVNWLESLKRGKLSATLTAGSGITPADERIAAWVVSAGVKPEFPLHLNLDGDRCGSFLKALGEHPGIKVGKTGELVAVQDGGRLDVEAIERSGDFVTFRVAEEFVAIGGGWFRLSAGGILKLGPGAADSSLQDLLVKLASTKLARIPLGVFLQNVERWQEWLSYPETSWLDGIHFVPAKPSFEMQIDGSLDKLEAVVRVRYGDSPAVPLGRGEVPSLPKLNGDQCEIRNWIGEREALDRLMKSRFESIDSSVFRMTGERVIVDFLAKDFKVLETSWGITLGERLKIARKQVIVVEPAIDILGSGEDWMSFDFSFQSDDGRSYPLHEIRKLLAAGKSTGNKRIVISEDVSNMIEPLFAELDLRQEGGHFVASKRAGEVIEEIRNKLHKNKNVSDLEEFKQSIDLSGIKATLRVYQTRGVEWLLDRVRRYGGALLADDMGLGKTIQTIACIDRLLVDSKGSILIVATASLLGNWQAEFGKFAPHLRVRILHGSGRVAEREAAVPGDILLTTFGTLPRDLAWYLKQKFRAVVVDEASLMRNPDTDHAKAISRLDSEVRIALTGTPVENGVRDLWSIFRFIQPGWLGGREEFRQRYESAGDDRKVIERLKLKTSPFMLRRTKEEVAPELPSKIFIEEYCELSAEQQSVYRDLLAEGRKRVEEMDDVRNAGAARMRMLTALLRLRQTCCDLALFENDRFKQLLISKRSAKLERLLELISEGVSGNHKILVFSQFQKQLREIEKCLEEAKILSLRLDGQTRNRQDLVDRFQSEEGPPVFLISLKAGGYGLNLTAADIVIHFDPWWNPAAEAQATDRAHRIGQTRPVTVYRLIARGTVEEKVVNLQNKKKRIAGAIGDSGETDAAGWTEQELMGLLES